MLSPGSFGAVLTRAVAVLFGCFYSEGGFPIHVKQVDVWSCPHCLGQGKSNPLIYWGERSKFTLGLLSS